MMIEIDGLPDKFRHAEISVSIVADENMQCGKVNHKILVDGENISRKTEVWLNPNQS